MSLNLQSENYRPWLIDEKDFPRTGTRAEQLFFLVRYAVLAPSSHNAQPWHFSVYPDRITVGIERKRAVPIADPADQLLRLALGAAIENMLVAARYFGLPCQVRFAKNLRDERVAELVPGDDAVSRDADMFASITRRHVDRAPFKAEPLAEGISLALQACVSENGVLAVTEGELKDRVGECYLNARDVVMAPSDLRREMAGYKRTNFTRSPLGIPGFTMGFSNAASLIVPTVLRLVNVARLARKAEAKIIHEATPRILVLGATDHSWEGTVKSGQFLERIMLTAVKLGYATSIMASATVNPDYREKLRTMLGWPTGTQPFIMLRLGKSTSTPKPSPRLSAEKVTTVFSS